MNPQALAQEIIDGRRLTRQDDLKAFLTCDLQALCEGADKIRKHFVGERVDLCSIINGRSGRCPENCKFCAQSAHNHTDCEVYSFLPEEDIVKLARLNQEEGVHRFSIVTAWASCPVSSCTACMRQVSPAIIIISKHLSATSLTSALRIPTI